MQAIEQAVRSETADVVRGLASKARWGKVVHALGIPGLRFRWPDGVVLFTVVEPIRNIVNQAIEHFQGDSRIRFAERTAGSAAKFPNWISFEQRDGCWSQVRMRRYAPPLMPSVKRKCL